MKRQWKGFISGIIVTTLIFTLGIPALAATVRQLNANYSGIKITLDGKEIVPKDANGVTVEPFAVDGTTYLPLRPMAGALGLDVQWDGATQTVKMTTPGVTEQPDPVGPSYTGDYKLYNTNGREIIVCTSNTTGNMCGEIRVEATFYTGGKMVSAEKESYFQIPAGRELAFSLRKPVDEKGKLAQYDDVEIKISREKDKGSFSDAGAQVSEVHDKGAKDIIIKATNNGTSELTYLKYGIVYFKGNDAVGFEMVTTIDTIASGDSTTLSAGFPYDSEYKKVEFDDYKVFLLEAMDD